MRQRLQVPTEAKGERLDRWLATQLDLSRNQVQSGLREGWILVNGSPAEPAYRLRGGEEVEISPPPPPQLEPAPVPLEVLYCDHELVVVGKPAGVPTHPGPGHWKDTLVQGLLYLGITLSPVGAPLRPGVVHRLDKDTSGLLVLARTRAAHRFLVEELRRRRWVREYVGFAWGQPPASHFTLDYAIRRHPRRRTEFQAGLRGKPAKTFVTVVEQWHEIFSFRARLETGRTHQIRVHIARAGYPVVGDPLYGRRKVRDAALAALLRARGGQFLHAERLEFRHPRGQWLRFHWPPPPEFAQLEAWLKSRKPGEAFRAP